MQPRGALTASAKSAGTRRGDHSGVVIARPVDRRPRAVPRWRDRRGRRARGTRLPAIASTAATAGARVRRGSARARASGGSARTAIGVRARSPRGSPTRNRAARWRARSRARDCRASRSRSSVAVRIGLPGRVGRCRPRPARSARPGARDTRRSVRARGRDRSHPCACKARLVRLDARARGTRSRRSSGWRATSSSTLGMVSRVSPPARSIGLLRLQRGGRCSSIAAQEIVGQRRQLEVAVAHDRVGGHHSPSARRW